MKVTYGSNQLISFKNFYLIIILVVFFSEQIFYELVLGKLKTGEELPFNLEKFFLPLTVVVTGLGFFVLSKTMRWFALISLIYLIALVFESKLSYGSFFIYPHVFSKIMYAFVVFFSYIFFRNVDPKNLKIIASIILVAFFLDLLIYNTEVLSFSAFLATERGFSAASTYLLLFAGVYFFNLYLEDNKTYNLIVFLVVLAFVVFLQHRTIWISAAIILVINLILIAYKTNIKMASRLTSVIVIVGAVFILLVSFVLIDNPEIQKKLYERFSDIQNYKSEGTGSWRYMQFQSYWPYIEENLLFGMRLEGFELPIQFYHPEAGLPFFDDGTGHHFHSLYLDKLFYMGIVGLVITCLPLVLFFNVILTKKTLTIQEVFLTSFITSAIVFGISYNWPIFVYAIVGMGCAFTTQREKRNEDLNKTNEFDFNFKQELVG